MNKVRVTICGKEYALKTEESASYFYALAKKVEKEIDGMVAQSDSISVQSAAVLAALSAFDEAQKANESWNFGPVRCLFAYHKCSLYTRWEVNVMTA